MNKILNLLTMCRRAGKIEMGFDPAKEAVEKGKSGLILIACDLSSKTEKEVRFFAQKQNANVIKTPVTIQEYAISLGKKAGVFAICDEGFSRSFIRMSEEVTETDNN